MLPLESKINQAQFVANKRLRTGLTVVALLGFIILGAYAGTSPKFSESASDFTMLFIPASVVFFWSGGMFSRGRQPGNLEFTLTSGAIWLFSPVGQQSIPLTEIRSLFLIKAQDKIKKIVLQTSEREQVTLAYFDDIDEIAEAIRKRLPVSAEIVETTPLRYASRFDPFTLGILSIMIYWFVHLWRGVGESGGAIFFAFLIPILAMLMFVVFEGSPLLPGRTTWKYRDLFQRRTLLIIAFYVFVGIFFLTTTRIRVDVNAPCNIINRNSSACLHRIDAFRDDLLFSKASNALLWIEHGDLYKTDFGRFLRVKTTQLLDGQLVNGDKNLALSHDEQLLFFSKGSRISIWDFGQNQSIWEKETAFADKTIISSATDVILIKELEERDDDTRSEWSIWNFRTNQNTHTITGIRSAALSPTQPILAYQDNTANFVLLDLSNSNMLFERDLSEHDDEYFSLVWSPDGSYVALESRSEVAVYSIADISNQPYIILPPQVKRHWQSALAFSPDNKMLVYGLDLEERPNAVAIQGWHMEEERVAFTQYVSGEDWRIEEISFSNDGDTVGIGTEESFFIFDYQQIRD